MVTALVAGQPAASADALGGSQFKPGYIISDYAFYNDEAMTESEIQSFLNAKAGTCKGDGCINRVKADVESRAKLVSDSTGNVRCEAFKGGKSLSVAALVYRAQVACGVSAKVILVTLHKEQGLIGPKVASQGALDRAMGYACPDTAPCAPTSLGLGNQIYMGTLQLKTYKASKFGLQPGVHAVRHHPKASCGTVNVRIENYATAALYNYTPYTPNKAALANLGGTGDACSSYGNRNFWVYYNSWFGSPTTLVPEGVDTARLAGSDRFGTAIAIARDLYPDGAETVFVTFSHGFADGLSAAPAAALANAPLLLTRSDRLLPEVKAEIARLAPSKIVVVGGEGVVSRAVYGELSKMAPEIRRDAGADRYATARAAVYGTFPAGTTTAYVASGENFPDALSASAAAGAQGAPVVLVRGSKGALEPETADLLRKLGVVNVVIAGGPGAVNAGIETALRKLPGVTVTRLGGADRFATASLINAHAFPAASTAYIASGHNFPDALAGAAAAGVTKSPLYLSRGACTPTSALQQVVDLNVSRVALLGGPGVLTSTVEEFLTCG